MKDQNGLKLKAGSEVVYCDDLFQVAGEHEGRAILWPLDPCQCGELIVVPSELLMVSVPIKGFWYWLRNALYESAVPKPSGERAPIAHA